jgi:hypothetical protein
LVIRSASLADFHIFAFICGGVSFNIARHRLDVLPFYRDFKAAVTAIDD